MSIDETSISHIHGLDQYQAIAFETAIFPAEIGPLYCTMGALGEAGELGEVLLDYYIAKMKYSEFTPDFVTIVAALEKAIIACKDVERLKKLARKGKLDLPQLPELDDAIRARICSEQGDCLWYQAGTATVSGLKLSEVAQQNITKLRSRRDEGVIASSGETIEERRATTSD